jgi:hypothetical protein
VQPRRHHTDRGDCSQHAVVTKRNRASDTCRGPDKCAPVVARPLPTGWDVQKRSPLAAFRPHFSISAVRSARAVRAFVAVFLFAAVGHASPAAAQRSGLPFELTGEVPVISLSELGSTNVGVGGIIDWNITPEFAIESSLDWFPGGWNSDSGPLKDEGRLAGLLGVKAGRPVGRVALFGRAHVGFLNFSTIEPNRPFPCLSTLVLPSTLECRLASGYTALTINFGGGGSVGLDQDGRVRLRLNISDLMVRYRFPSVGSDGQTRDSFYSNNLLFSAGVGWRF